MGTPTPLHETHRGLGASFVDFAGWSMPVRYGNATNEHHAVRATAGLFDLCHMGEIELTGPAAATALDHALVGHASKIAVGRARYSMLCDEVGGILDDLVVYRLAEDHFLIVANAANVDVVDKQLRERVRGFDAELRNTSSEWALLAVQGPAAAGIVSGVTNAALDQLRYYAITTSSIAGHRVLLARTGYTGEDGFEIYCRPTAATTLWQVLHEAGKPNGLVPAGLASRDTLRLEAGMPLYGNELSRSVTPFEAGLGRVVVFGQHHDFVGEQALARRRDSGAKHVLVGLATSGRRSPRTGYTVLDPATQKVIGQVTSGAPSPTLGHPVAMAYVPAGYDTPQTQLAVDLRGSRLDVHVVSLPFYSRPN